MKEILINIVNSPVTIRQSFSDLLHFCKNKIQ